MTNTIDGAREFNDRAIRTAEALQAARSEHAAQSSAGANRERVFGANRVALGVALEYEYMNNQPVSGALQKRADDRGVRFEHLGLTIGTVIHGVDCRNVTDPDLTRFIRDTLLERKVIFFRDQNLTEDEQVAFGRTFGDLDAFPFGKPGENPFILSIEHGPSSPGQENGWHTDVTWMERPSLGSIAQCVVAPPVGGDTLFSDSFAAYRGLRPELQEQLKNLRGVNDYRVFVRQGGRNATLSDELVDQIKADIPFGVSHPLLRTHPESGRTALYIHGGFLRHDSLYRERSDEPLDPVESQAIVRELLGQHARPEYTCRFTWQPGSIAFWDNRSAQHYAASDYHPHERVLRRVTVSGDRPYYEPGD